MSDDFDQASTRAIVTFLREIGLSVIAGNVDDQSFLPGIEVVDGGLIVDESKLKYFGDLLHEAGHLAVTPSESRSHLSGEVETPDAEADIIEAAAMCWSYAACLHLKIAPEVVFHEHGYHGRSRDLLFNFSLGVFPGLHELVSAGMTSGANFERGLRAFPAMQKWLRD